MGNTLEKPLSEYQDRDKTHTILIVGLHQAGKSTILYRLKHGEFTAEIPDFASLIGTNAERIDYNGKKFIVFDHGGRERFSPFPSYLYRRASALIFVVDSSDSKNIVESKNELWRILQIEELKDIPVLVIANKQDLPNAMSTEEIAEKLEIRELKDKTICMQGTCEGTDPNKGLQNGLCWIQENVVAQEIHRSVVKPGKKAMQTSPTHYSWLSKVKGYLFQTISQT